MIRPLRRRHLWLVLAVGVLVGALAIAGLLLRPAPAIQDDLPETLRSSLRSRSAPEARVEVASAGTSRSATP